MRQPDKSAFFYKLGLLKSVKIEVHANEKPKKQLEADDVVKN